MNGRPNILWIVTTQWRGQALGYADDPNARTPRLDRLAAESVNFTQAVTPHPFGPFARAAMLTGKRSPENGLENYFDPLPLGARTVAHDLAERGYATAFFGKWHLWKRDPAEPLVGDAQAKIRVPPPARGGFEFWEGFEGGFLLNDPWLHGSRLEEPTRFKGYQSDVLCERACGWLETAKIDGRPWFCLVSLEAPHPPYDAPAAGVSARDSRALILNPNVPRGGEAEAKARRELAGYYAHGEATDRAIGRLLDAASPSAAVVFTSVHGDMHGAHGLFRKGWPHEESVRIPLLVRSPPAESANKNSRSSRLVTLLDLSKWTLEWADSGGADLEPDSAAGPAQQISMPSVVGLPHQCDRAWRGARTRSRKLVLNSDDTPWLFFNLDEDPGEITNQAGDPARAEEIRRLGLEIGRG